VFGTFHIDGGPINQPLFPFRFCVENQSARKKSAAFVARFAREDGQAADACAVPACAGAGQRASSLILHLLFIVSRCKSVSVREITVLWRLTFKMLGGSIVKQSICLARLRGV
jgi:hypothetical protein